MSNYYYLISSLPMLLFHHATPLITYNEFVNTCKWLMDQKGCEAVLNTHLIMSPPVPYAPGVLQNWQMESIALRNELVRIRAKHLEIDAHPFIHAESIDPSWVEPLKACIEDFNPLRVELHLMELQWSILEHLQSGHQFDLDFLIVYALKLQLLERKSIFNKEAGMTRIQNIINNTRVYE